MPEKKNKLGIFPQGINPKTTPLQDCRVSEKVLDKIIFLPHYIGSLKYFEKLAVFLKDKYEILFVFLPKVRPEFLKEMTLYCQKKQLKFQTIKHYQNKKFWRFIPFF